MGTVRLGLAAEEIAAADMGIAISLSVHVLSQLCIFANGTDEQKDRFLPAMTAGRELGAFALTEPGAGSDAAALSLAARRDGDAYLLTGTKIWITNAGEAARYVVFATVDRSKGKNGITAFVVEADTPGFRLGSKERKMGIRGTTGYELVFEDARVPAENRLGEEGDGLSVALSALGAGRIGIAAACTGLARNALELAARYALQRRQFGRAIADQEMIQAMLAEMAVQRRRRTTAHLARGTHAGCRPADQLGRRAWPSGTPPTRRCASRPMRSRSTAAPDTRATTRSNASCAMRRARRSTRERTRSIASSWRRASSTPCATRPEPPAAAGPQSASTTMTPDIDRRHDE